MSEPLKGIVISHAGLAEAMVRAVEQISGVAGALVPVSNTGCDAALIEQRLAAAMGNGPAVVFVDMPSGSCFFAAMRTSRGQGKVPVVTGVNLPMLVDFVFNRTLSAEEAANRAVGRGGDAIRQR
jgi:mannose PTS system EIIA component